MWLHPLFFSMAALHPGHAFVFASSHVLFSESLEDFSRHLATISHWQGE